MTGFEVIQQLMTEIGPQLELAEVAEFTAEKSWVLVLDDTTIVSATFDESQAKLVFASEVAVPNGPGRHACYERLLVFNNQWASTGGLRFALDMPAGTAVLLFDLPLVSMDLQRLSSCVESFIRQVEVWRLMIAEAAENEGADETKTDAPGTFPTGMIRA